MPSALRRKPLPKPSPESDPRYRRVMEQLKQGAARTKKHPPAAKKAADAAKAAKGPPNERVAGGKAKQVDKIKEAKEGKPEQASFLSILRAEIEKVMPKTLGATDNFDSTAQQMKGGLKGNVADQKDKSTQDVSGASKATPGPAGEAKAGGSVPPEAAGAAPNVAASEGMPSPKSEADVSLQDSKQDVDAQMNEAEVTPTQLQKANDPRFSAVLDAKGKVAQNADAGPGKYRAQEKATLSSTAAKATSSAKAGAAAMLGVRTGGNAKVLSRQEKQKADDEKKRKDVVDKIESIYTATKGRVEAKLNALDGEVNGMFDRGVDAALNAMTSFVNARIRKYKIDRYLSIPLLGLAAWVKDQFMGLPDEVNAFYEQGRQLFQSQMDALIVRVANVVETRLREAKQEVAKGQQQIKDFVASQPKDLQAVAKAAASEVNSKFEELERGIEDKKNSLAQSLAQKYKEGFDKANEALKKIQDENKGLVQAFAEKLGEVIKAIMEFKAKLQAILAKGEATIKLIIADPIGFLGNLIAAVKGGLNAFVGNIWTHLKKGFMAWLFGNMPPGVAPPSDLSLPSIFKLVLGVLGITYDRMRAKAVKLLGERTVGLIEKLVSYIQTLIGGGPAALWEQVKGDLATLKGMVIDAIQDWLITTIVKNAIAKIVSMFNPAGAIIQAIMAIYNIVMFVIERAAQIMTFVESVINSVHAIATGAIGGAIKAVESALANAIPIVIGFLARLIGLGGISQKIREFITRVQAKVDAAIDKVLKKIVDTVKKLFGKVTGKDKKPDERTPQQKEADLKKAVAEAAPLLKEKDTKPRKIRSKLSKIKERFKLTQLELKADEKNKFHLHAEVNPIYDGPILFIADLDEILIGASADAKARLKAAVARAANEQAALEKIMSVLVSTTDLKPGKTISMSGQAVTPAIVKPSPADILTISGWGSVTDARRKYAQGKQLVLEMNVPLVRSWIVANAAGLAKFGYTTAPHPFDFRAVDPNTQQKQVWRGSYFQSHAEKQSFISALEGLSTEIDKLTGESKNMKKTGEGPIVTGAVSRPVCSTDCFPFMRAAAQLTGAAIVLADPQGVWIFEPSGFVILKVKAGTTPPGMK